MKCYVQDAGISIQAVVGEKGMSTQMSQSGITLAYEHLPATQAICGGLSLLPKQSMANRHRMYESVFMLAIKLALLTKVVQSSAVSSDGVCTYLLASCL